MDSSSGQKPPCNSEISNTGPFPCCRMISSSIALRCRILSGRFQDVWERIIDKRRAAGVAGISFFWRTPFVWFGFGCSLPPRRRPGSPRCLPQTWYVPPTGCCTVSTFWWWGRMA